VAAGRAHSPGHARLPQEVPQVRTEGEEGGGVLRWLSPKPCLPETEGAPGVVKAVGIREANVAASGRALGVAALHPHDGLRDASFGGDGEAAHAAGDASEGGGVDPDGT
jgi:hypothetical protein